MIEREKEKETKLPNGCCWIYWDLGLGRVDVFQPTTCASYIFRVVTS